MEGPRGGGVFAVSVAGGGSVAIDGCSVTSDMAGCIAVSAASSLDLTRTFVHGGEGVRRGFVGVRVLAGSSAHIEENEIALTGRVRGGDDSGRGWRGWRGMEVKVLAGEMCGRARWVVGPHRGERDRAHGPGG